MSRLTLVAVVVVALAVACGGDDNKKLSEMPSRAATPAASAPATNLGSFRFVGFADHAGPSNVPPADVTPSGGTIRTCNPPSLYAWVNFTGLTPPKTMTGTWTLNGARLSQQMLNQTQAQASTYWQVQNTPAALAAGAYVFELMIDGTSVSRGQFTLTC